MNGHIGAMIALSVIIISVFSILDVVGILGKEIRLGFDPYYLQSDSGGSDAWLTTWLLGRSPFSSGDLQFNFNKPLVESGVNSNFCSGMEVTKRGREVVGNYVVCSRDDKMAESFGKRKKDYVSVTRLGKAKINIVINGAHHTAIPMSDM